MRFSSQLYYLRQRPCFSVTPFLQTFPHLSWELISNCISFKLQVHEGAVPFHHSGGTSVLLSPPPPAGWKQWRLCLDAAGQSRPARRSCCGGASQVHIELALKDTVFKEQKANRISGHVPPSSNLIKQDWLTIKKENNSLSCASEPPGKYLTAVINSVIDFHNISIFSI